MEKKRENTEIAWILSDLPEIVFGFCATIFCGVGENGQKIAIKSKIWYDKKTFRIVSV